MTAVKLHLYDLSQGMARAMSMSIIGKQLDGIWHSGIAVFGVEYFYGGGICASPAGQAIPHLPYQEIHLGQTSKSQVELEVFLQSINHRFTQATYSLLRHNCNNFANEVSTFLLGTGIPEHIIRLPQEFLTSPMGAVLAPMIEGMEQRTREEMTGHGRGLNPFAHIEGRTLLFPAIATDTVKAVADGTPVSAEGGMWLEGDLSLLQTAVSGIPVSLVPQELKNKISVLDETVVEDVSRILKGNLADKTPILLTFATIVRYYWKLTSFRDVVLAKNGEGIRFLEELFRLCMNSSSTHVVNAGLSACVNVLAGSKSGEPFPADVSTVVREVVVPKIDSIDLNQIKSMSKVCFMLYLNWFRLVEVDEATASRINDALVRLIKLVIDFERLPDRDCIQVLVKALEVGSRKVHEAQISQFQLTGVDTSAIVEAAQRLEEKHGLSLQNTLILSLE